MRKRSVAYSYLFAVASVLAALVLSWLLLARFPIYQHYGIFTQFLLAVAFVSWRQGFWPGVAATGLSAFFVTWYFIPPVHSLSIPNQQDLFRLVQFLLLALLINSLQNARARAEQSLKTSEQRLAFSLESAEIGAWDADIAHRTFWRSNNLPSVYGITGEFATTYEGFFAYIHPEDRDFFHLAAVSEGTESRNFEITHRVVSDSGQVRRVTTRGIMHLDSQGNVDRMVGTVLAMDRVWKPAPIGDAGASDGVPRTPQPVSIG